MPYCHSSPAILLYFSFPLLCCSLLWTAGTPPLFGFIPLLLLLSLLHSVPWVPRGDRQRMRTLIVTPARAKPCIFNLLWHYSPSLSLAHSFFVLSPSASCPLATAWFTPSGEAFHLGPQTSVSCLPLVFVPCCVYKCVCVHVCVCVNGRHLRSAAVLQGFTACVRRGDNGKRGGGLHPLTFSH